MEASNLTPPLTVGLVQYNSAYAHYLPYSVGLLQAYTEHHFPHRFQFLLPRIFAAPVAKEVNALLEADVVAFSCYVWNIERSLAVAKALKAKRPELVTIFGGPQIPDNPDAFLDRYAQVDLCCIGEGETVFLELLQALSKHSGTSDTPKEANLNKVFAIEGLAGNLPSQLHGQPFFKNPPAARRKDLEALPSPYLTGTFDKLMAAHPNITWSILWETNRGCPFTCGFCDWGSATAAKVNRFDTERLKQELDWFTQHKVGYIFCCDANFGILPRDVELAKYAVELHQNTGYPGALAVQNAKNTSDRTFAIQCMLAESGLDSHVTLSLQSLYPPALKASGRANISLEDFERLQAQLRERGIHTYTDLILGLPEETFDSFVKGYCEVIERGQYHAINVYILDILPNAGMANPVFRKDYGLQTVKVPSVNFHRPVKEKDPDGIIEWQELVIATRAMPSKDWAKTRQFVWLAELLFFKPGLLRIPFLLLHAQHKIAIETLLTAFLEASTPLMRQLNHYFNTEAKRIQAGHPVYIPVPQQLQGQQNVNIWKGAYDGALYFLVQQKLLGTFYQEAEQILTRVAGASDALQDALFLSATFAHLHHQQDLQGLRYTTRWNVWDYYQGQLNHQPIDLAPQQLQYAKPWAGAPWRLQVARAK